MSKINLGRDLYIKGRIGWKGLSKDEYLEKSDYRIINATSLMDGYVDWNNCGFITKERYEESPEIMLKEGDILISKDGTIGKIGYVKDLAFPCTVASGIFVVRNTKQDSIDFDYLYHILKSHIFKDFINRNKALGSTISHLYQRDLEQFEIEIPDLPEQKKIADVLNTIDNKIANNLAINAELMNTIEEIFNRWFKQFEFPNTKGVPYKSTGGVMVRNDILKKEIPEGWSISPLKEILKKLPTIESIKAPDYRQFGRYPIVDQASEYITGRTDDERYLFYNSDECVVFGDVTTYFKYINFDFARGTDGTKIIQTKDNVVPAIILYFLIKNARLPNIGFARHFMYLKEFKVLIPAKDICEEFVKLVRPMTDKHKKNVEENYELSVYKEFILPLLISGQALIKE